MKALISIVIPCYNDSQYIEQAVDSALNQTYKNIEVIVVDDGSNFETKEILNKIEPKITKLITQENQGVCVARNNGIASAKGEYIVVLDSDDYFERDFVEKAVRVIKNNEEIGMITCWFNVLNEEDKILHISKPSGTHNGNKGIFYHNSTGSCFFRKKIWKDVGGYDLAMKAVINKKEINFYKSIYDTKRDKSLEYKFKCLEYKIYRYLKPFVNLIRRYYRKICKRII